MKLSNEIQQLSRTATQELQNDDMYAMLHDYSKEAESE